MSPSALTNVLPQIQRCRSQLKGAQQPVNSYVWNSPDGDVLIDPAADFPVESTRPTRILVTHVQVEHSAGAALFPATPLWIPAGDEYLCDGAAAYEKFITRWEEPWDWESRGNFQGHMAGARNERPPQQALPVAGVLRDGDAVGELQVLSTPGHGKNALTYLVEIDGQTIAFCGDLILGNGQLWNWFDCDWDYGLQGGQKSLLASARRLLAAGPDILLPAHGEPVFEAQVALQLLIERQERVLREEPYPHSPLNFPEKAGPAPGWREISPHLFQWKEGNCALLVSREGTGLMVDDGLCNWVPLPERAAHHEQIIAKIKKALGLSRIEVVLPTHFHGDHTENIPGLVALEKSEVVALDVVAEAMAHPERFNLSAALWWYNAGNDVVPVDRVLRHGEKFSWREYDLEIFHLGGQTYHHAGILTEVDSQRVLFAGDAIFGWNPGCEPVLCYNDCEPSTRGWAYSARRLLEKQPDVLVCGHGSAVREPIPLLKAKVTAWNKRLEEFDALNPRADRREFFDPFYPSGSC